MHFLCKLKILSKGNLPLSFKRLFSLPFISYTFVGDNTTALHRRAAGILVWKGLLPQPSLDRRSEVVVEHRTCASTTRCCTCDTHRRGHLHGSEAVRIVRLHQPRLRERFSGNGLQQGYVAETVTVIVIRLDRSWCWAALVRKIIVFCFEPLQWYQS